jgi:hypothetical protein
MKIADSFDKHWLLDPNTGCWNWQRGTNGVGYGKIYLSGNHKAGNLKETLAHRFSYERVNGPIPDGMFVCHHCDNRKCVNPAHLFAAPQRENVRDMLTKGRARYISHPRERNGRAKLSEAQIKEIRLAFQQGGITKRDLARQFGVHDSHIGRIVRGELWREQAA